MKKVKKMESLKNFSLSAEATSKLDGGFVNTGPGSHASNRSTWMSDAMYSKGLGDSKDLILFYNGGGFGDSPIANHGGDGTVNAPELSFDGLVAVTAQPAESNLGEFANF